MIFKTVNLIFINFRREREVVYIKTSPFFLTDNIAQNQSFAQKGIGVK